MVPVLDTIWLEEQCSDLDWLADIANTCNGEVATASSNHKTSNLPNRPDIMYMMPYSQNNSMIIDSMKSPGEI